MLVDEKAKDPSCPSVSGMLKNLDLSKSNYYDWKKREPLDREYKRGFVCDLIQKIYDQNKGIYGAPKICHELRKRRISISVRTVGLYMRQMGLRACYITPWTTTTRDPNFEASLQNILDENFNPDNPDEVWCIDTTYIPTDSGFVYLTSIIDLFSRKIVAWDTADTLSTEVVLPIIEKAKQRRNANKALIMHSDRGSQFTSDAYKKVTSQMTNSYSAKGYPWDNACIESFHALIKREWLTRFKIKDIHEAHRLCFEYIDAYYNTVRIHSHCDYMTPMAFEQLYYENHYEQDAA